MWIGSRNALSALTMHKSARTSTYLTDHTISFLQQSIDMHVDRIRKCTICLDNTQICKNKYLLGLLKQSKVVDLIAFRSLTWKLVMHTRFKPDKPFASIAKMIDDRDVFCIEIWKENDVQLAMCFPVGRESQHKVMQQWA